jgi:hypothetical protein
MGDRDHLEILLKALAAEDAQKAERRPIAKFSAFSAASH